MFDERSGDARRMLESVRVTARVSRRHARVTPEGQRMIAPPQSSFRVYGLRTTSVFVVVGDPHFSNQSMPSLTRSNFSA
jgi:hypothetical protein